MNALIPSAWAQAGAAAPSGGAAQIQFGVMMVILIAVFYFMLIRPQQKRQKEHQAMISKLSVGDEVVTTGGILGKVTDVGDTFVTLEIGVGDSVRIKVQKVQVTSLMPKGTLKNA